ncbi:MAG TPA: outer membrane protein assembly factor BamA [Xanthobacteraceae bacterium]|nr:outer membrane protein assembly factor BamA [Xanthobacteraceae bacterium]
MTVTPAFAQVSSIAVEGNRRVEADTIRSYFKGRDAASIDAGLKALYATGLFQDVRISQPGGRLVVTVVENPVLNRVAFEGNKKLKDEQLTLEVQSKPRGTFSRPMIQADTQRIIEVYRRAGRYDVRVVPKVIELPNNRVDLVYEITEGQKTGVKRIDFAGNRAYSSFRLKDVIKTSQSNWLSFLQTSDVYDPDRLEADRDLLRRFYLNRGYADVRIVSAMSEYDPALQGFVVTFNIEEGQQYRIGSVDVQSNVGAINAASLNSVLRSRPGDVYSAEAVEKTVEAMTVEVSKRGYAFAAVRPRGDRDYNNLKVNLVFLVEEGPRAYIERINIRGNTRTRDFVIRREFDVSEGDAYNRALIDRAERRLKNLGYFKTVKIGTEPGSAPDRVVLNVDVEDQATGEFSVAGGYSSTDGMVAEISVAERNMFGEGKYGKATVRYGEYTKGVELSYAEPFLLGYRMSGGIDLFAKQSEPTPYLSYGSEVYGTTLRLGFALTEEVKLGLRYSVYQQDITLSRGLNNCINREPPVRPDNQCYEFPGEASLPVRIELAQGAVLTSLVGYTLGYNTVDDNRNPTKGIAVDFRQDFAGVGGDVNFIRSSIDVRRYHEILSDAVGVLRLQAGNLSGWGDKDLRMLDHFQLGPTLVRGFAPSGIGPRERPHDEFPGGALGSTNFWGASVEVQYPLFFMPKEVGLKAAVYADVGDAWGYEGPTFFPVTRERLKLQDDQTIRSSVGAGIIWASPFGPLRLDYAIALSKTSYDRTQEISFGGGAKF